jgi:hypothetical protein
VSRTARHHQHCRHHEAFVPLLQRMATEDIGTVAMEAFERVERGQSAL